jgi:hypothetical protein
MSTPNDAEPLATSRGQQHHRVRAHVVTGVLELGTRISEPENEQAG